MSETSRRGLIAMTGAGAAAGAISLTAGRASAATAVPRADRATEPVVAIIDDASADRVRLHVGEREVVLRDRDLVTRILNAAGGR